MVKNLFRIGSVFAALSLFCCSLEAQTAYDNGEAMDGEIPEVQWKPVSRDNGRSITLGAYTIENRTLPLPGKRSGKSFDKNQMWRSFMHGVADASATPVPWQMLEDGSRSADYLDKDAVIDTAAKSSTLPAAKLNGGQKLDFPLPLMDSGELYQRRGEIIRLFVWIKAENTGQGGTLWEGSPVMDAVIRDADGRIAAVSQPYFRTRGSFPWFCYHIDVQIPYDMSMPLETVQNQEEAAEDEAEAPAAQADEQGNLLVNADDLADSLIGIIGGEDNVEDGIPAAVSGGLWITLKNPVSGTAWFSTLSWQKIIAQNSLFSNRMKELRADPVTGSMAPNPDYDELPMHFFYGLSKDRPWNFMKGTKAMPDITEVNVLEAYIGKYKNDWAHAVHAIPYLATVYTNGMLLKSMPDFEKGWLEKLGELLLGLQNPASGLWETAGTPNLFSSWLIASNSFSPETVERPDRETEKTPWLSCSDQPLKHADEIIKSVLSQQKRHSVTGAAAGWNVFAFNKELREVPEQAALCQLPATAAAAGLLRQAIPLADEENAAKAENAIYDAWYYVMNNLVFRNALWKQSSLDRTSSTPDYMFAFLENTRWLEFRINDKLPALSENHTLSENGTLTVTCQPGEPYNSVRIFAAPEDVTPDKLNENHLIAIIQPRTESVSDLDPLMAVKTMADTAAKQWRTAPSMENASYTASKLANLQPKLIVSQKTSKVKVPIHKAKQVQKLHLAGVTPYGEMSPVITFEETVEALEEEGFGLE